MSSSIGKHDSRLPSRMRSLDLERIVQEHWAKCRIVASNVALEQDTQSTLDGIAKAGGIGAEADNPGMVVSLGGFYIRSHKVVLWNWLERATL